MAIRGALSRAEGMHVERIILGNVVQAGNGQNPARQAAILAGVPRSTVGVTINDVCLSSITAIALAKQSITLDRIESVLVGGFESMTNAPSTLGASGEPRDLLMLDGLYCSIANEGMGPVSDRENFRFEISREAQDLFSLRSHQLALASEASRQSQMYSDIPGIELIDQGIRTSASLGKISSLSPAFSVTGTITAANASQMSDAGSVGFLASEAAIMKFHLAKEFEVVDFVAIAGPDSSLHLRPAEASQILLKRNSLTTSQIDAWEINEAFAGVVLASIANLEIDINRVNLHGGAIAIGHPLAASGLRIVMSLCSVMSKLDSSYGIAAICGGGGQGAAVLIRRS
jgi:acetyl-CoA C-acetyltransferase